MEDSGTLTALHRLARIGRVDSSRVLVLRTASNFSVPPPGKPATWSATAEYPDRGLSALESAYLVGSPVVGALVSDWDRYRDQLPKYIVRSRASELQVFARRVSALCPRLLVHQT